MAHLQIKASLGALEIRSSVLKTAVQAPLMNATCERFIGSVRRECLDHVIILSEAHLKAVLVEWVAHSRA